MKNGAPRRLSDFLDRNEKLNGRDQNFEKLSANSRAIWRNLSELWADQSILQSIHDKSATHLGACRTMRAEAKIRRFEDRF